MAHFILPLLQLNVADKLKNAPDNGCQIGVIIVLFFLSFYWLALRIGCIIRQKKQIERSRFTKFAFKLKYNE